MDLWVPLLACPAVFLEHALLGKPAVAPLIRKSPDIAPSRQEPSSQGSEIILGISDEDLMLNTQSYQTTSSGRNPVPKASFLR